MRLGNGVREFTPIQKLTIVGGVCLLVYVCYAAVQVLGETHIALTLESQTSLEEGLVGHWTFDGKDMLENVADVSGEGNHGELVGATTTVEGVIGQALELQDGKSDWVEVRRDSSLRLLTNFSVSGWFYAYDNTNRGVLQSAYADGWIDGWRFSIDGSGAFYFVTNTAPDGAGREVTSHGVGRNRWYHFVGTYDGSETRLYLNGELEATDQQSGDIEYTNFNDLIIGGVSGEPDFAGRLDEIRIYNRVLSPEEVVRLYQLGAATKIATTNAPPLLEDGLIGHWTFDGKHLLENVADASGQGNHGLLAGFTATTTTEGALGQALLFDGMDDYVAIDTDLVPTTGTFAAWIRPSTVDTSSQLDGDAFIFSMAAFQTDDRFYIFQSDDGLYIRLGASDESAKLATVAAGEWYHIALTYGGGSYEYYVNGESVAQGSYTDLDGNCDINSIGAYRDVNCANISTKNFFAGAIDDVRLYDRALTAEEVEQLYEMGS